jgi:hypothetical protein
MLFLFLLVEVATARSSTPTPTRTLAGSSTPTPTRTPIPSSNCGDGSGSDCGGTPEVTSKDILRETLKLSISFVVAAAMVLLLALMWPRWRSRIVPVTGEGGRVHAGEDGGDGGRSAFRLFEDEEPEDFDRDASEMQRIN